MGFDNSAELWSDRNLGNATSGSGALSAYAVVSPKAFDTDVYSIARLRYHDLEKRLPSLKAIRSVWSSTRQF